MGCAVAVTLAVTAVGAAENVATGPYVYFGTYTNRQSKGIYVARFDPRTGAISTPELAAETVNPSFLAIHPTRKFLYAVGEVGEFAGRRPGP